MAELSCPHCGAVIELQASIVQAELPLGPIEFSAKKVIDSQGGNSQAGASADRLTINGSINPTPQGAVNRLTVTASCEEDLIESVQTIVGRKDFNCNGGLWRAYSRQNPKALAYAIEDWKLRTPDQQREIKNKPAWLTDRYKRALAAITTKQYKIA